MRLIFSKTILWQVRTHQLAPLTVHILMKIIWGGGITLQFHIIKATLKFMPISIACASLRTSKEIRIHYTWESSPETTIRFTLKIFVSPKVEATFINV